MSQRTLKDPNPRQAPTLKRRKQGAPILGLSPDDGVGVKPDDEPGKPGADDPGTGTDDTAPEPDDTGTPWPPGTDEAGEPVAPRR